MCISKAYKLMKNLILENIHSFLHPFITHEMLQAHNTKIHVVWTMYDTARAFNCVNHEILIKVPSQYGMV